MLSPIFDLLESRPLVSARDLVQEVKILGKAGGKSIAVYMKYPKHPKKPGVVKKTTLYPSGLWQYTPPNSGKWGAQIVDPPPDVDFTVMVPDKEVVKLKDKKDATFDDLVQLPGVVFKKSDETPPPKEPPGETEAPKPEEPKTSPSPEPEPEYDADTKDALDIIATGEKLMAGEPTAPAVAPPPPPPPLPTPKPKKPKVPKAAPLPSPTPPPSVPPVSKPVVPEPPKEPPKKEPPPKKIAVGAVDDLPDPQNMTLVGSGQYLGGAGEKVIYEKDREKFIFKVAAEKGGGKSKPYAAHVQEAIARIMSKVKPGAYVPIRTTKDEKGRIGTIQPLLKLGTPATLAGAAPSILSEVEKTDVATEHLIDWLFSQHDSHGANLIRVGGRVLGVDKEQAYKYSEADKLDTDYHPNGAYGENEPFYNTFWRSFGKGQFDFDPRKMRDVLEKIEAIPNDEFDDALREYAKSMWGSKKDEIDSFILRARKRKLHLRRDFEKFITKHYKQRTKLDGEFSFDEGWVPSGEEAKKKKVTKYAKDLASAEGISVVAWKTDGKPDPDYYSIRVPVQQPKDAALAFLAKMGITPTGESISGGYYHHIKVKKSDWDSAKIEVEEEAEEGISVKPQPPSPKYFPDYETYKPIKPGNVEDLKTVQDKTLGRNGHRIKCDGPVVEGQTATVKRVIGDDKKPYYTFFMKLRRETWQKYKSKGTDGYYSFKKSKYDAKKDALVEQKTTLYQMPSRQLHKSEKGEAHLCTAAHEYSFMGALVLRVPEVKGQSPEEALRKMVDKIDPELTKEIFRNPTPEETEIARLSKLLWAKSPKASSSLQDSDRTVAKLKQILLGLGVGDDDIAKVEDVEVGTGYSSTVQRGRHKQGKLSKLKFFSQGRHDDDTLIDVLQHGCLSIFERAFSGRPTHSGISASADISGGGGDATPASICTESHVKGSKQLPTSYGPIHFIISPEEADRLDLYAWPGDTYMKVDDSHVKSMKSVEDVVDQVDKSGGPGLSEACFRKMVPPEKILRVAVSDGSRAQRIRACKKAGISEVNGVPIDDFIVECKSIGEMYEKYVKPLGF
jgi:hypothetical protein